MMINDDRLYQIRLNKDTDIVDRNSEIVRTELLSHHIGEQTVKLKITGILRANELHMLGAACSLAAHAVQLPSNRDFQTQPTLAFGPWGTMRKHRITILPNSNLLLSANSTLRNRVLKFLINSFTPVGLAPVYGFFRVPDENTDGSVGS